MAKSIGLTQFLSELDNSSFKQLALDVQNLDNNPYIPEDGGLLDQTISLLKLELGTESIAILLLSINKYMFIETFSRWSQLSK